MSHPTLFFIVKVVISGILIAGISSLAKVSPKGAALLTALPLVTFLSLIWIYVETKDLERLAAYTQDVLLWTLPGLVFFGAAIFLFRTKTPFFVSLALSTAVLAVGVWVFEKLNLIK